MKRGKVFWLGRVMIFGLLSMAFSVFAASESDVLFDATLTDTDGRTVSLAQYRGQPLIVNFWARICYPCRAELPELNAINRRYGEEGLVVVAVAVEDLHESIRDFAKAYELDMPIMLGRDEGIRMMQKTGNEIAGLPYTLVIDRNGTIVQKKIGALNPEDIQTALKKLGLI